MKKLVINNRTKIKQQILRYFQSTEDLKLAYRLHCILTLIDNDTLSCEQVAKLHGTTQQTIARWIHAFNKTNGDINVLRDKDKPGRAPRVSERQLYVISDVLKKSPKRYGIDADKWEGETLSELLIQKFNIDLKVRQCQRIMKRLGFANKKVRDWSKRPAEL